MAETITATFRKPFAEQIAAWRLRLGSLVPTRAWDDIQKAQHDRAFMVAGAMKADLLADLAEAVGKSIEQGTSLEEFRKDFRQIVEKNGWHGWTGEETAKGRAWRTRVIYQTNMLSTYAAGRFAQLQAAGFTYWVYRHGGSRDPRIQHLGWDGLVLPADHPFWLTHFPPNGWGCSCYVVGARSLRGAQRLGGDPSKTLPDDWDLRDLRTGEPEGIGKGWGYAPGRSVAEEIAQIVARKRETLPAALGAALADDAAQATKPAPVVPELREAISLKDADALMVEAGIAERAIGWPGGIKVDGVNQVLQAAWELMHRFDMGAMQVMGSATKISRATKGRLKPMTSAYAWYGSGYDVVGWNKAAFETGPWWQVGRMARFTRAEQEAWRDQRAANYAAAHAKAIAKQAGTPGAEAARRVTWQHAVVVDGPTFPRAVAVHELGHRLHYRHWDEITAATRRWIEDGWHLAVSNYGTTNVKEFVAESFVIYIEKPAEHWRIKPELLAVFRKLDKLNG